MKKKELEDLGKDELIEECKSRGRLIKILLNEMEELDDKNVLGPKNWGNWFYGLGNKKRYLEKVN